MEQRGVSQEIDTLSVDQACEQVQDGRDIRGVRSCAALTLMLIILAKLVGMSSLTGIAQWVRFRGEWLSEALPETPKRFPLFGHMASGSIFLIAAIEAVREVRQHVAVGR
jgi:hypothetical protein